MPLSDPPPRTYLELRLADRLVARLSPGGAPVRIGRSGENDVVLDDPKVSREHARIEWPSGAEAPLLVDLGSVNGVSLDGTRVTGAAPLGSRGAIEAGGSALRYALEDQRAETLAQGFNLPDDSCELVLEERAALAGAFEEPDDLFDVLRGLERAARSGTLALRGAPLEPCWVAFAGGMVIHARYGKLRDLAALERVLELQRGAYRFTSQLQASEGEFLDLSISEFLARGF